MTVDEALFDRMKYAMTSRRENMWEENGGKLNCTNSEFVDLLDMDMRRHGLPYG